MTTEDFTPIRSFLFTPANHPRRVEKVFEVGADAVILDLEDAVAISEKSAARQCVVRITDARIPGISGHSRDLFPSSGLARPHVPSGK